MSDRRLRQLERQAAQGDPEAQAALDRARRREIVYEDGWPESRERVCSTIELHGWQQMSPDEPVQVSVWLQTADTFLCSCGWRCHAWRPAEAAHAPPPSRCPACGNEPA